MNRIRRLLILLFGLGCLFSITLLCSSLEALIPRPASAPTQTQQAGPYQVTLQVAPNPPSPSQPATLTLQIVRNDTRQLLTDARVEIAATMEGMVMDDVQLSAARQSDGTYQARFQFAMSGAWDLRVSIVAGGKAAETATFAVMAK